MKPRIKIYDKIFAHTHTMSNGHQKIEPDNFTWYRGEENTEIAFYTDFSLSDIDKYRGKHKYNIAMLMESPGVFGGPYNQIKEIEDKFDYIFTFDSELLNRSEKYIGYSLGGTWIPPNDWAIYNKTKFISMISSVKSATYGQKLRHSVKSKLNHRVDIFGEINQAPIKNKLDGLKDYMFSIVTENCDKNGYFTEKLIDCFLTGTIPIYFGCKKVNELFNGLGIIRFNSIEYLESILKPNSTMATTEVYEESVTAIAENFMIAKKWYAMPEQEIGLKMQVLRLI